MANVKIENLNKSYGALQVVHDLSLEVADKEFLVLLGPSGCGKSTTLRMIAGLEDMGSGNILIGETNVNKVAPRDRDIAMVFQDYALYPHKTVGENMSFGLALRKTPKQEIEARVAEAAEILGIEDLLERKPRQLSGGQRQRVALGRAIVRKPAVFLFDEPLSNLDAKLRGHMRAELSKLHRELQTTIIYVTHDQVEAMTMASKIAIMEKGVVQQVGSPMEIYETPENLFVGKFIGNPGMNVVPARVTASADDLFVQSDWFQLKLPRNGSDQHAGLVDREVLFGIRPEDIEDASFADNSKTTELLTAEIELVETLGSEVQLGIRNSDSEFVARVDARTGAAVGQSMELAIDMEKCHLFSTESPYRRIQT